MTKKNSTSKKKVTKKAVKDVLIQSVNVEDIPQEKRTLTSPINTEEFNKMLGWLKDHIKSQTRIEKKKEE